MTHVRTTSLARGGLAATVLTLGLPGAAQARCIDEHGDPCPAPQKVAHVGTFNGAGSAYLEIRASPRSKAKIVRRVRSGARALIVCQTRGARVTGPYGTGRIWDKLYHGGYISDTRVYTGADGRVAPDCATGAAPAPAPDRFMYDDPGAWNGGKDCSGGFRAGATTLSDWLKSHYRFTGSIGGYACRQNTANAAQMSLHAEGRALDWMANWYDEAQRRAVSRFVTRVSAENWKLGRAMGIQELIWNKRIWTASRRSEGWRAYTGPYAHRDHIHIGLNRAGAAKRTSFYR